MKKRVPNKRLEVFATTKVLDTSLSVKKCVRDQFYDPAGGTGHRAHGTRGRIVQPILTLCKVTSGK